MMKHSCSVVVYSVGGYWNITFVEKAAMKVCIIKHILIFYLEIVTDFEFADDIALLSEVYIISSTRTAAEGKNISSKSWVKMNAGKTKFMSFNQSRMGSLQTNDGTKLKSKISSILVRGWKAQQRIISNAKQQRGEHAVNCLKSGSHLTLEDPSYDYLRQLWSQFYDMAVKPGLPHPK